MPRSVIPDNLTFGLLLRSIRAPFLVASCIPVLLGAAVALHQTGQLSPWLLVISVLGCCALHAGANVANDYFDWLSGADTAHPPRKYSGGSQVLQSGLLMPHHFSRLYRFLYLFASLLGLYISWLRGPVVLIIGLLGLSFGHWYTAPPVAFSYHGLGELVTGLTFGPLAVLGSYYVQTSTISWQPVAVALPVGLLITAVLYINEFPDRAEDASAGKNNLVVKTDGRCFSMYEILVSMALISTLLILVQLNLWFVVGIVPLIALAAQSIMHGRRLFIMPERLAPVQSGTLKLHAATGLLLTVAYVLGAS